MEPREYENEFFRSHGFKRQTCKNCHDVFWSQGPREICAEKPCTPYSFIGRSPFSRKFTVDEFREFYLNFFEKRGHTRIARYPVVPRWRDDVLFVQASIYDFQPWVTSGAIEPPANPLVMSQPSLRFNDIGEVGVSGRHLTGFEMLAHHAFNKPGKEIYFKEHTVELCHELLTSSLGVRAEDITYKEEVWEGGGDLGPSLSVGVSGMELATLVFMQYMREGEVVKPLPLTVVDTGYGLERFAWMSQGTNTIYETVFPDLLPKIPSEITPPEAAILADHARVFALILADGVVPSNVKEGYLARLLLRRIMRILEKHPGAISLHELFSLVIMHGSWNLKEIGANPKGFLDLVDVEEARFHETLERGRSHVRRLEERLRGEGKKIGVSELLELYDSMGLTPDVVVEELKEPVKIPDDFFTRVAKLHEKSETVEAATGDDAGPSGTVPLPPHTLPPTEVLYQKDPYTMMFSSTLLWVEWPWVLLDRTYFYPTGGGQITDTGRIEKDEVVEVARKGPFVLHRLGKDSGTQLKVGQKVDCSIDATRRRQLMQHHTATHILNGALREVFGPHIWQAGAYKGIEGARLDVTHYKSISDEELRQVERIANRIVSEDRPVKSYFSQRRDAEARFGFTLYQGGAVPGKEIRIVEIEGFDVEACGGTHCTHTSEVGLIKASSTERIQDGMVRVNFTAGDRALQMVQDQGAALRSLSQKLAVPPEQLPQALDSLLQRLREVDKASRSQAASDVRDLARKLLGSPETAFPVGGGKYVAVKAVLNKQSVSLKEIARELTNDPKVIAILASEEGNKGMLFIASGSPKVHSAVALLDEARKVWPARGGGSPSAAMAYGDSGESLLRAVESALSHARKSGTELISP